MKKCENFDVDVLGEEGFVVADFYADWCGPCRLLMPVLEEIAAEMPDIKFVKVNVENNSDAATKYGVNSIPNIILFHNGKQVSSKVGGDSKANIKAWLEQAKNQGLSIKH